VAHPEHLSRKHKVTSSNPSIKKKKKEKKKGRVVSLKYKELFSMRQMKFMRKTKASLIQVILLG
jgi:hypothetical protein